VGDIFSLVIKTFGFVYRAVYMMRLGIEYACMLVAMGMAFGEISNLAVLYIFYIKKNKNALGHSYTVILK
jgi:hypothetical protein